MLICIYYNDCKLTLPSYRKSNILAFDILSRKCWCLSLNEHLYAICDRPTVNLHLVTNKNSFFYQFTCSFSLPTGVSPPQPKYPTIDPLKQTKVTRRKSFKLNLGLWFLFLLIKVNLRLQAGKYLVGLHLIATWNLFYLEDIIQFFIILVVWIHWKQNLNHLEALWSDHEVEERDLYSYFWREPRVSALRRDVQPKPNDLILNLILVFSSCYTPCGLVQHTVCNSTKYLMCIQISRPHISIFFSISA